MKRTSLVPENSVQTVGFARMPLTVSITSAPSRLATASAAALGGELPSWRCIWLSHRCLFVYASQNSKDPNHSGAFIKQIVEIKTDIT